MGISSLEGAIPVRRLQCSTADVSIATIGVLLMKAESGALIAMVRDDGWALPDDVRQRVLSALVYFADPKDIIPDNVPVLGYFDDAIAIELCVRELRHEIDAYDEFCDFRQTEADRRGMEPAKVGRADWLASRRDELQDRMHRQRTREAGTGYGSSSGYARSGYTSAWRPGLLRIR